MKVIGVTGGIGMGKSTAATLLSRRGVAVIDTDVIAREVVRPGRPGLDEIQRAFGAGMLTPEGALDREAMARVVFADAARRKQLEEILHPRIRDSWLAAAETWRQEGRTCGVVIIPLLFETGAERELDAVVCLACTVGTQQERLRERGWSDEEAARRQAAQWPVQRKMDLARFVVWTEGPLEVQDAQWTCLLRTLGV